MVIGIGCDIVEHNLTELLDWMSNDNIMRRVFSKEELDLYENQKNKQFIAGRFAAK
jgi:holo-[acyl-carrier protein] synthase